MQKKEKSKSELTKEKIQHSVAKLMKCVDLSELNVREICKDAGISIGTFYLYFPCKEAAVLYCYRQADQVFDDMELSQTPLENIEQILDTYVHMVYLNDMSTVRQLYVCHIKYHDPYFFDENRPVFIRLYHEIESIVHDLDASKQIAMRILTMARGLIFHICCIEKEQIPSNWYQSSIEELMHYVFFLIHDLTKTKE